VRGQSARRPDTIWERRENNRLRRGAFTAGQRTDVTGPHGSPRNFSEAWGAAGGGRERLRAIRAAMAPKQSRQKGSPRRATRLEVVGQRAAITILPKPAQTLQFRSGVKDLAPILPTRCRCQHLPGSKTTAGFVESRSRSESPTPRPSRQSFHNGHARASATPQHVAGGAVLAHPTASRWSTFHLSRRQSSADRGLGGVVPVASRTPGARPCRWCANGRVRGPIGITRLKHARQCARPLPTLK